MFTLLGPQPVDGTAERELGRTQPLDEVAAAALPGLLHGRHRPVRDPEAAVVALGEDRPAGDHAVAVEQAEDVAGQLLRRRRGCALDQGPPSGRRG